MTHTFDDWCQPKFMEALPLMRIITGIEQNSQVDSVWREVILKSLGPDGLIYIPLKGRPWARVNIQVPARVWRADGTSIPFSDPALEQFCAPWNTMRVLSAMTIYYMQDQNPMWRKACEKMIDRIMHCCTGNGSRTLYYIWESMLQCNDGRLRVNLLMNRVSAWGDVYSYIPYQGRVELKVKKALKEAAFRAPSWIKSGDPELKCTVNGRAQKIVWEGRYVKTGARKAGDKVSLTFPISETTLKKGVAGQPKETLLGAVEYDQIVFKGSTVVHMEPEGQTYPKYRRDEYRQSEPRMKKVQRFISRDAFYW